MVSEYSSSSPERLIVTALLPAGPKTVFDHFTKPDLLMKWWPQKAQLGTTVGSRYHLEWSKMDWHLRGEILLFERPSAFAYTWKWDHQPDLPERTVKVSFEAEEEGTVLTLSHGDYGSGEAEKEDRQTHLDGWRHFLAELRKVLEARRDS